ncbi:hypothetical protein [Methylobacterium sp. Leaf113]|uniref:hypothetical protein n=1 Tax=Methylobacterium sp. Leaf113 TaxID=1736259 RepID=UPI000AD1EF50|nr:hypothetical protein [Methylobacterium sp. Leaf113]
MMTVEEMAEGIGRAHGAALDALTRALWAGVAAGQISDEDAGRLVEAIQARRTAIQAVQAAAGRGSLPVGVIPKRKRQRPPERSLAIERRRRLAASGPMPSALAARFTTGELAVLRIVADEFQARQVCALCLDAIAARAGVSRTLAKGALRQARRLGMVEIHERRRTGAKSLPNLVRVVDREWLAWMKRGASQAKSGTNGIGGRFAPTTDRRLVTTGTTRPAENLQGAIERGKANCKGIA